MSATFSRTLRSLRAQRSRMMVSIFALVVVVLVAWAAWLVLGKVAIYEVTASARLEVRGSVYPVAPSRGGRIVRVDARIGQEVTAGEVLFEIDPQAERLALDQGTARQADLHARIAALDAQISAEREGIEADREASDAAVDEAQAWVRQAQARESRAEEQLEQAESLLARDLAPRDAVRAAQAEVDASEAEVRARRAQARRLEREGEVRVEDREAQIAELESARVQLEGQIAIERAGLQRLQHEIDATAVVSPVDGRIAELTEVRVGSVVETGQLLAEIIPEGELHVVALFPTTSAGRIEPEQSARLRFPGYPWTQFGTVGARVTTVSEETVDGRMRVELTIANHGPTPIPMEHSLPTVVEVEVERVSPLALMLRAAGKWVDGR